LIHSFTVTFGAKYLTGMVTSVPPNETFSLFKNTFMENILWQGELKRILKCEYLHVMYSINILTLYQH
jgi:hypothetical protein